MRRGPRAGSGAAGLLSVVACALATAVCRGPIPRSRVVVAVASGPVAFDPDLATEEQTLSILGNVYEPLVERDAGMAPAPALASSWIAQEQDRRWVFRLRGGARFHDGHALEAADVVASLERTRARPGSVHRVLLEQLERVEATDAHTVSILTRYPLATLPDRLTNVRITRPAAQPGELPVGSGPYRVASWAPGGDVLLQAARAGVQVRELEFRVIADPHERAAQLIAGGVDLVPHVDPGDHTRLRTQSGLRTISERGLRILLLGMDCSSPESPFRDVRVRRALALGVDPEALVRGPLRGEGAVVAQLVTPVVLGHDPGLLPPRRDPAAARKLLAQAGYGGGLRVELDYMPDKYRAMPEVAQALVSQLAEIGVSTSLRPCSVAELLERVRTHTTRFSLTGWMTTGWDAGVTYSAFFHSGGSEGGGYANAQVDRLLEQAEREFDMPARGALYREVARLTSADAAVIPLYQQFDLYAASARLRFFPRVDRRILGSQLSWLP